MTLHRNYQETRDFSADFDDARVTSKSALQHEAVQSARQDDEPQIGIALSGGGIRAAVFHLGVLSYLADQGMLEKITAISTVSGGSLIAGLIFATADSSWPSSHLFLTQCLSQIRARLTQRHSLQRDLIASFARRPWQIRNRNANQLAESIRRCWDIHGSLEELPKAPRWVVNATTYETGKNWRFVPHRSMGDYSVGYVRKPVIPIADAMAASAAVPGLIGNYVLDVGEYNWYNFTEQEQIPSRPCFDHLHLWDGSVYDFLGTEALFKVGTKPFPSDVNILIVSDASQPIHLASAESPIHERAHRLVTIATDQVRSLRTRTMINYFQQNPGRGAFLKIGTVVDNRVPNSSATLNNNWVMDRTPDYPFASTNTSQHPTINRRDAEWAASMETTLRQITHNEFELIFQHGWEVARFSLRNLFPQSMSSQ